MRLAVVLANVDGIDRYFEQLKHAKIKGYLFQQRNYVPKESEG